MFMFVRFLFLSISLHLVLLVFGEDVSYKKVNLERRNFEGFFNNPSHPEWGSIGMFICAGIVSVLGR